MKYRKIVIAGGGVLGSQIAFQTAYSGFDVTILIRKEDDPNTLKEKLINLRDIYIETINKMDQIRDDKSSDWARGIANLENFDKERCIEKVNNVIDSIKIVTDQQDAVKDADLIIESVTENMDVKIALYKELSNYLNEKTVIVTNSSTLLPSKLAKYTGRPDKYLSLHFANSIWKNNIAEVMCQPDTNKEIFNEVIEFAEAIHMIPLAANEEKSGYILNSMLVPFLLCAMDLLANGVSDVETIDKAWTLGTGAPKGPFRIIDTVGLMTAKNIVLQYQKVPNLFDPIFKKMMLPYNYDGMLRILEQYIAEGKTGKDAGEGFYKY